MTSMEDIARKANVSRATVSRVLSGHPSVKATTRSKVMYWVKELNYQPNFVARSLAGNKTKIIGVIVPEISNPFYAELIEAIENQANYEGYSILLSTTKKNIMNEKNILNEMKSRKVDGIITIPVSINESPKYYKNIGCPVVTVTKKVDGISFIGVSHYNAGRRIAKHLIDLGYQKVGYVGATATTTSAEKFRGFQSYLNEHHLEIEDVIEVEQPDVLKHNIVFERVKNYIECNGLNVEAFFANDDLTANEIIKALEKLHYDVPSDVGVIGFDNTLIAKRMNPSISTLAQPLEEIGRLAVDVLIENINNNPEINLNRNIILDTRVIARESTLSLIK